MDDSIPEIESDAAAVAALELAATSEQGSVEQVGAFTLLRVWLSLGIQSFGGGSTTLTLIRREFVDRRGWIDEAEFSRYWALVQVVPGINILALTILIGKRICGWQGIIVSLAGLLLPSGSITVALTALWTQVQRFHAAQFALKGIIPVTVGIGLVTALQIARPLLQESHRHGIARSAITWGILLISGTAAYTGRIPVVGILLAGGFCGALTAAADRTPPNAAQADGEPAETERTEQEPVEIQRIKGEQIKGGEGL